MELGSITTRAARYWPDQTALVDARKRISFSELEQRANQVAYALIQAGVVPGDRVAVQAWNRTELVEAEVACYKAACVKVPINSRLSTDEALHMLRDSGAKVLIAGGEHAKAVQARMAEVPTLLRVVDMDEGYEAWIAGQPTAGAQRTTQGDDVAVLHYTSGSSGVLKAAMQTFGNRQAMLRKFLMSPMRRAMPGDVQAHVGPITHASGMNLMYLMYCGAASLLLGRFEETELLQTIERERVTRLFMVPTMINRIVNHPNIQDYDLGSLRLVLYGAAPMAPALVEKAIALFGPILVQGYGAGETNSMVTILTEQDHVDALAHNPKRLASCGRCYAETEVRVVNDAGQDVQPGEVGEIIVRGEDIMKGYWNAPELTAEAIVDGYYRTGDLAMVDQESYIYIVDRKKEMIICGGFNIYPAEIEQVLFAHPAIYEAAAVGIPDEEWGEQIKAVVVLKPGHQASAQDILAFCTERLPGFKRPRSVDFIQELPKNPNGKIVRRLVREPFWAGKERRV
ncbi:AMP-binding protein [Acidovorax sp. FJL06]|uniref:AMP-binding protein n=1 Tax=Acidovorax sp. FJL06 TaxID=2153365 RepID=UPI000F574D3C|nr:AMP-binding protein [Acidovorax sp. FJL06]RQO80602.1 AMP-dependent synthetase [Acidovorax sp. FJL06]